MKYILLLLLLFLSNNCSLNKNSKYWIEDSVNIEKKSINKLVETEDISNMTLEEYEIYIDEYAKKGKYPNINK